MSLVPNYGSSSESDDSDHELVPQKQTKRPLASLLPPPKKTVSIALPKLEDDEEDDLDRERKRPKTTVGLGLADLLPAPKNYKSVPVSKTTTDKAFIPYALSKKMKGKERVSFTESKSIEEEKEEEKQQSDIGEEEVEEQEEAITTKKFTGSFFHIGKDLKEKESKLKPQAKPVLATPGPMYSVERPPVEQQEPELAAVDMYAYDPNAMYSSDPSIYYQYEQATNVESLQNDPNVSVILYLKIVYFY